MTLKVLVAVFSLAVGGLIERSDEYGADRFCLNEAHSDIVHEDGHGWGLTIRPPCRVLSALLHVSPEEPDLQCVAAIAGY